MARTFDGPLSADDLVYLRQRYSNAYVERQVALLGVKGKANSEDAQAKAEAKAREAQEQADREAEEARLEEQRKADEAAAQDLIGDVSSDDNGTSAFDVLGATEAEVKTWAADASDEDKAAALATEKGREDRDARKGVVAILS